MTAPIKPGTLCLLVGPEIQRVGMSCTVTGYMQNVRCTNFWGSRQIIAFAYVVELSSGEPSPTGLWVAERHNLIPIDPPGLTERETTSEPARESA